MLQVGHGYFAASTGSGTQEVLVPGVSEQLHVVRVYAADVTVAQDETVVNGIEVFHGWHVNGRSVCCSTGSEFGALPSDVWGYWDKTYPIRLLNQTDGTTDAYASIALGRGKFTVTWHDNPTNAIVVFFDVLAWGNEDDADAVLDYFESPSGAKPYLRTDYGGFPWTPSGILTIGYSRQAEGGFTDTGSTQSWAASDGTTTMNTGVAWRDAQSVGGAPQYFKMGHNTDKTLPDCQLGGTAYGWGQFVKFVPGGVRLSWTTPQSLVAGYQYAHVFLKGIPTYVLATPNRTATGTENVTLPFAPRLVMLWTGVVLVTSSEGYVTNNDPDGIGFGGFDGTRQGSLHTHGADDMGDPAGADVISRISLDTGLTAYDTDVADAVAKEATLSLDGNVLTFDYTVANGWANDVSFFVAYGQPRLLPPPRHRTRYTRVRR